MWSALQNSTRSSSRVLKWRWKILIEVNNAGQVQGLCVCLFNIQAMHHRIATTASLPASLMVDHQETSWNLLLADRL